MMFATYLYLEEELREWTEPSKLEGTDLRSMMQVWDALSKLDGNRYSFLIVAEGPPEPETGLPYSGKALVVAGGKNNQYLCEAEGFVKNDSAPITVRNPDVPETEECVTIKRGQEEDFPKHNIIERDVASEALEVFVKRGELSDQLIWEVRKGFKVE